MDIPTARLDVNGVDRVSSSSSAKPRLQQDNRPDVYAREVVTGFLKEIEQARTPDKLELLAFLARNTIPDDSLQLSLNPTNADPILQQLQESVIALEAARAKAEMARVALLQGLQASLPAYIGEAIGEPVQHRSSADRAFIKLVQTMRKAQRTGAEAVRHFDDCDNQTKLMLLGYSHSGFFLENLKNTGLPHLYETFKEPFLSSQQVGFAYKDGFNEMLVEGLPDNQRQCFRKILAEPDYEKRKETMEVAILNFLESPDAVPVPPVGISSPAEVAPHTIVPAATASGASASENEPAASPALLNSSSENATVDASETPDATVDYQFEAEAAGLNLY